MGAFFVLFERSSSTRLKGDLESEDPWTWEFWGPRVWSGGPWRLELGLGDLGSPWASGLTAQSPLSRVSSVKWGGGLCHSVDGSREGLVWMGEAWM